MIRLKRDVGDLSSIHSAGAFAANSNSHDLITLHPSTPEAP
jgi:hypothetical protein